MNNEDLNTFFKAVSFRYNSDGFFVGQGQNNRGGTEFKIAVFDNKIACFQGDALIFQVPLTIDLGTFLVLTQEFGIIHERFIYERVEAIEDEFIEGEDSDWDDEEDNKQLDQIAQMKNSKFMQLLTKGGKKIK
jgi:hypothetical protein